MSSNSQSNIIRTWSLRTLLIVCSIMGALLGFVGQQWLHWDKCRECSKIVLMWNSNGFTPELNENCEVTALRKDRFRANGVSNRVGRENWGNISTLQKLETLHLEGVRVDGNDIRALARLYNLKRLILIDVAINVAELQILRERLEGCTIEVYP